MMDNPTPLIRQGWIRAVVFVLVFFAGAVAVGTMAVLLMPAADKQAPAALINQDSVVIFLSTLLAIVLSAGFRKFVDRRPVASMGFTWQGYQHHALVGFLLGPALLGLGTLILYATRHLQWNNLQFHPDDLFISLVLMMLVALGEEMVFRGYILRNLMKSLNKWLALGISTLLFALAHLGNPGITAPAFINLILGGLLLGINYIYTRNLWFALLFHVSWNYIQGPVLGYSISGVPLQSVLEPELTGPGWLTGGAFGFEGSLVGTMVMLPALLLLFWVYERQRQTFVKTN
jgi:membrane protease YdiL (CAAX protease family)